MASNVSMEVILDVSTKSLVDSFKLYYDMSRGDWLAKIPEYWFSSGVARSMSNLGLTTTLETPMKDVHLNASHNKPGSPPNALRINGQCDIMIWWDSYLTPRALIEVKQNWCFDESCKKDIGRICAALKKYGGKADGPLQFGLFLFATDASDKGSQKLCSEFLLQKGDTIRDQIKDYIGKIAGLEYTVYSKYITGSYCPDEGMMASYGFMIRKD